MRYSVEATGSVWYNVVMSNTKMPKSEYSRLYREKHRKELNAYQRAYYADPEAYEKHAKICADYRANRMKPETKEKIREYQRRYYQMRKKKKNEEAGIGLET